MNAPVVPSRLFLATSADEADPSSSTPSRDVFAAAAERLEAIVRRNQPSGRRRERGLERLLCALCLSCGIDFPIARLAAALPLDGGPLDIHGLRAAMANLGFHVVPSRAPVSGSGLEGPLLIEHRDGGTSVLLPGAQSGTRMLMRPCGASEALVPGEPVPDVVRQAVRTWTFRHGDEAHPVGKAQRVNAGHSWFRALLSLFSGLVPALFGCTVALAMSAMVIPLFTIYAFTQIIALGSDAPLPGFVSGALIVIAIEAVLLSHRRRMIAFVANRLEYLVATASLDRLLKIRPAVSETMAVADQAARLRSFDNVRGFLTSPAFCGMLEAPASIAAVLTIALLGGWVALVPAAGIAAHLTVFALVRRRAKASTRTAADHSTEMQKLAIDTFEKREEIRDAGIAHMWSHRIAEGIVRQQRALCRLRMVSAWGEALSAFVLTASAMLLLWAGAEAVWREILGGGALLAVIMLGLRALVPFHMLCLSVQRVEQVRNSVAQLNQLMELEPERAPRRRYAPLKALEGRISFVNTGHRAGDTRPVFVGLDMEIAPGSAVAVTGSTGSGKTTVLKMVQGMTDLSIGTVRIDGVDLRQLPLDELRRRIGYVPQRPHVFAGSLRDNLLFVNPLASDGRIAEVLEWTGLSDELAAPGRGLDRSYDAHELDALPQAFRFRFAIAQALLVGSRLILVDEMPNAVLDGAVGDLVRRTIALSQEGRTVLFVTQRSDFLRLAGRVITLRYGKAPTITTPDDLLARSA